MRTASGIQMRLVTPEITTSGASVEDTVLITGVEIRVNCLANDFHIQPSLRHSVVLIQKRNSLQLEME